jgi:phospholipase/carboxylesterase
MNDNSSRSTRFQGRGPHWGHRVNGDAGFVPDDLGQLAPPQDLADDQADWDWNDVPTSTELAEGMVAGPTVSLVDVPHAIALPDVYEPGYAYPVIVWFHPDDGSEEDVFRVLPAISERNYIGVALRGNVVEGDTARWSTAGCGALALSTLIDEALNNMEQRFSIRRDRVFLAGVGSGGTVALELLLETPERFAGAACLCGVFPGIEHPLARYRGLRGRRVLLSTSLDCPTVKVIDLVNSGRVLYTAGLQVGTRIYQSGGSQPTAKMLRDIDHWVMDSVASAVKAPTR